MEDLLARAGFDHATCIHHGDAIGDVVHYGEVVRDVQERGSSLVPKFTYQIEHLRLRGYVEPGRRLVKDNHERLAGQCDRDCDALLLSAAELERVAPEELFIRWQVDSPYKVTHDVIGCRQRRAVSEKNLTYLAPDPVSRIQGCWILRNV
jgi:hypothetical protein